MLKAICSENVKQIPLLRSSSDPGFILVGFSASSNLNEFLLQPRSSFCLKKISFVPVTSACNAVMEFLCCSCVCPELTVAVGWFLDEAAWLTQSCVAVLSLRLLYFHSFGSSSLPPFQWLVLLPQWISL